MHTCEDENSYFSEHENLKVIQIFFFISEELFVVIKGNALIKVTLLISCYFFLNIFVCNEAI